MSIIQIQTSEGNSEFKENKQSASKISGSTFAFIFIGSLSILFLVIAMFVVTGNIDKIPLLAPVIKAILG